MSSKESATLRFELQPSARLRQILVLFHLVCAGMLLTLPLHPGAIAGLLLLLGLHLVYQLRPQARPVTLIRESSGLWLWQEEGEEAVAVELLGDCYVSTWLVIVHCRDSVDRHRHSRVVLSDSLPVAELRRLRVALRQDGGASPQAAGR